MGKKNKKGSAKVKAADKKLVVVKKKVQIPEGTECEGISWGQCQPEDEQCAVCSAMAECNDIKVGKLADKKEKADKKVKIRKASRRGRIIEHLQGGKSDRATILADLKERGWMEEKRNSAAISGTIADLRKNKNWAISTDKKGIYKVA